MSPENRRARPMISSSNVVLPTPLRPITATVSPSPIRRSKSSTMVVRSQPPLRLRISSIGNARPEARLPRLAEVDGVDIRRGHDVVRRARHEHLPLHEYGDFGGESPHHLH